jgi:hypothetical protein
MDFGRIAVMICMDIYFPEIPRIYAFKGAEILFWPTVSHGPTQETLRTQLTARAVDNSLIWPKQTWQTIHRMRHMPAGTGPRRHESSITTETSSRKQEDATGSQPPPSIWTKRD